MITDEPYIYYVRCNNHPNLAIQANSREEYKGMLDDYKSEVGNLDIVEVEIMTVEEYKRRYK